FLGLQALSESPVAMFSPEIDAVWHLCIQFTRQYEELCALAFGRFIHHRPTAGHEFAALDAPSDARARFAVFRALYERYYGPIPPVWLVGRPWAQAPTSPPR